MKDKDAAVKVFIGEVGNRRAGERMVGRTLEHLPVLGICV